ncbi:MULTISPECIES: dihydrolipoamide acetyltransferase family protein [unclassified Rhizobium]|jgi:2-oxoisovalerate dehydrogenase E2 component (dihydrolipoyl transacylase)|uniref:dihydrolipoamide acetyltransferase family protein n=1 Tax=unclassified Rhizobium TaxID=2613769 RepID=UPI000646CF29|nr:MULTISPECIES: dihydrolipoamide acetyltransferase family protein [unclassified Rhizobium]MBN8953556.1 2-oxo acid dehydrogenase subunit E2 [Rhizobium tropici]OJY79007.1 MAG: branched-chain alpha-keto acid dehydrogenase subunit E2 [Rhizobium sp. 60-20]RKD67736.1 branched-chain alpha-keto acid dehydrogenase E2 component [Rhizobium sp. WW_1]
MPILSIKLPDIGEGITQVELLEWQVAVGSDIREDDVIAAVMTDKATVEIPSLYHGTIVALGCQVGDTLAVGSELVRIEVAEGTQTADVANAVYSDEPVAPERGHEEADRVQLSDKSSEESERSEIPAASSATITPSDVAPSTPRGPATAPRPEGEEPLAAPSVRWRARNAGVDLRQVKGTGPAGRISHEDLDAVFQQSGSRSKVAEAPRAESRRSGEQQIKVIGLRRKIAERMSLANARIAHITVIEEVDVTSLEDLRGKLNADRGEKPKLTVLPFIIAALAKAMPDHPEMNAHFDDEAGVITRFAGLHLGIATMTESGLVVPVLRHAEALEPFAAAREIARLAEAARTGKATREELSGSTFTISSLGPLGALATTPIINHPEVAILGVNKMAVRPMWDGQQFVPRTMMNISASFDHRVIDGWDAAKFIQRLKTLLETPAMIFIGR